MLEQITSPETKTILDILHKHLPVAEWTADWKAPPDIDDVVHMFGNVAGALLYARLFVPEFRVVEGIVILDDGVRPEEFLEAIPESKKDLRELSDGFNWIEPTYIFANRDSDWDEDQVLAELIAEAWRGRLLKLFPDRKFIVEVLSSEQTGGGIGVGFKEVTE